MDYLQTAFGGLDPQTDRDAAVKFALNVILMDARLHELSCLLIDGHNIGGVEGEPGWIIERRDTGPSGELPQYTNWPANTRFHVRVDPAAFELAYPDAFFEAPEFRRYVQKAVDAYLIGKPAEPGQAEMLKSHLKSMESRGTLD